MSEEGQSTLFPINPVNRGSVLPQDPIAEIVGALTDAIIVFPAGGWEEDIPEKLKQDLPLHRLAHNMRCLKGEERWDEATDLEALIYLYPASLAHPMSYEWSRIYLYLGTKYLGPAFPEDTRGESLNANEQEKLKDLKRWIQKKKVEARKDKRKPGKAEAKTVAIEADEQMRLF